jgi:hypothetical protein
MPVIPWFQDVPRFAGAIFPDIVGNSKHPDSRRHATGLAATMVVTSLALVLVQVEKTY